MNGHKTRLGASLAVLLVAMPVGSYLGGVQGVLWGSVAARSMALVVLWPEASPEGFLPALADTCRSLRDPQILRRLRSAQAPEEVMSLLARPSPADGTSRAGAQ